MTDETLYKIRRKDDGLFSTGGQDPRFTKNGKAWKIGPMLNHLTMLRSQRLDSIEFKRGYSKPNPNAARMLARTADVYEDCEVVSFEVTVTSTTSVTDFKYKSGKTVGEVAKIEEVEMLARCKNGGYAHSRREEIRGK